MGDRILLGLALSLGVGLLAWPIGMMFAVICAVLVFLAALSGLLHREWTR